MRRSLTAVLAADVVGYSRMMGEDAETALATLRRLRTEIFGPTVASRRGRLIKSMGDGWIVAFSAVSDAVECAMQIQDQLKVDGAIQLRMGVHLGDVSEEGEDIYGEAVNVAARLEALADPGALAISGEARSMLDGALRPSFDDAGPQTLKNIVDPVHVWVRGGDIAASGALLKSAGFPQLRIAPVKCVDERAELRELATALTGDLVGCLNGLRHMQTKVSEATEPGAYRLTSRLRGRGDRLRLDAQLLDPDGEILTPLKFDGDLADAFDWQDEVAVDIANDVANRIVAHEAAAALSVEEDERTVAQWVLITMGSWETSIESVRSGLSYTVRAISLKPDDGYPYALGLLKLAAGIAVSGPESVADYLQYFDEWSEAVDRLEPANSPARVLLAFARYQRFGDKDGTTGAELRSLLRRMPFDAEARGWAGWLHLYMGEAQEALDCLRSLERGVHLDAYPAGISGGISMAMLQLGRFEDAMRYADKAAHLNPGYLAVYRFKAAAAAQLGLMDEAAKAMSRLPEPDSISAIQERNNFRDSPGIRNYLDGLRKAGMPE